jgi:hypothetical protein
VRPLRRACNVTRAAWRSVCSGMERLGDLPFCIRDHAPGKGGDFFGAESRLDRQEEKHPITPGVACRFQLQNNPICYRLRQVSSPCRPAGTQERIGRINGIFAPPRCERALWSRPAPPADGHASPRAILCRPARRGLPRPACCGSETAPGQPATPACNHMPGVVYAFYAPLPQADRGLRQPHALS